MNSSSYPKFHSRSHRKHRLPSIKGSIPNGYLEDCTLTQLPVSQKSQDYEKSKKSQDSDKFIFQPVSIIVTTVDDIILNTDNNYTIKYQTGIVEGKGLSINEGDHIVFENEGSYYFQISGTVLPYTSVPLKLVFEGFNDDIKIFSEKSLPKQEGAIDFCISTTLPINKDHKISVRIVPDQNETLVLSGGCRLLIFRVV